MIHTQLARPWLSFVELFAYCVIVFLFVRALERERRKFLLVFDLDAKAHRNFESLSESLRLLSTGGVVRGVKLRTQLVDWKRNGGATGAMSFEPVTVRRATAPYIESNVVPWCVTTQNKTLWFFPDRILIRQNHKFAALSYSALTVEHGTASFVWSEFLPRDAQVVGHTWQFVRKDGGPDRRFNNNRQIPIVCAAYISLESDTGLNIIIQTTLLSAARAVATELTSLVQPLIWATATDASHSAEITTALHALGLDALPTPEQLRATYLELAKRNHPDRFAKASPAIVAMADERMREINTAYALLSHSTTLERPLELEDGVTSQEAREVGLAWKFPTILATLACTVVFIWARTPPAIDQHLETRRRTVLTSTPTTPATPTLETKMLARPCTLRAAEGVNSKQVVVLQTGAPVAVLASSQSGWKHVRLESNTEGWLGPQCWTALLKNGASCRSDSDCNSGHCDGRDDAMPGRCLKR